MHPEVFYVGLDWAAVTHAVCVMGDRGKMPAQFMIEHTADGIAMLIRRLAQYGERRHAGRDRTPQWPSGRPAA